MVKHLAAVEPRTATTSPRLLDIACGRNRHDDGRHWIGMDVSPDVGAEITHDVFNVPWPIRTSAVREVVCNHFVEHIPHDVGAGRDGWFVFFDELYRVLAPGGLATFVHPYAGHARADWDPTHLRRIEVMTWYYTDAGWRSANGLDHYPITADFEVVTVDALNLSPNFLARSDDQQAWAREHYHNVIPDLRAILRSRKPKPKRKPKGKRP